MKQKIDEKKGRQDIYVSLISHTNVGKTSLARTLLREDIGDVRDEPHVTDKSEAYVMLSSPSARLMLWDTPGFGDVRKILKRVKNEGGATNWLLHHLADRFRERSLFCSVQALKNIRVSADLIFYLVNAHENPEHSGYPSIEMELLSHFNKKVIVVLNHIRPMQEKPEHVAEETTERWRRFMGAFPFVVGVYPLDAFQPIPEQEITVLQAICKHLDPPKDEACHLLVRGFLKDRDNAYRDCRQAAWDVFKFALQQSEKNSGQKKEDYEISFMQMQKALSIQMSAFSEVLMKTCRISLADQAVIQTELKDLQNRVEKVPEKKIGIWASIVSGAVSGLSADIVSGGLTFGGGALLGGVSGWIAAYYGTKGFNQVFRRNQDSLSWSDSFLSSLLMTLASLYLRVLHHGRARGVLYFSDVEETEFWLDHLESRMSPVKTRIRGLVSEARKQFDNTSQKKQFETAFDDCVADQAGLETSRMSQSQFHSFS